MADHFSARAILLGAEFAMERVNSAASAAEASDGVPRTLPLLPILVGITGKRNLGEHEASARSRLRKTFLELDYRYRHVPKVLLTGGASGADLIAAEVLVGDQDAKRTFPRWSVCVILPYDRDLFEKDFRPPDTPGPPTDKAKALSREQLERFRALVDASERVLVGKLPLLLSRPKCPREGKKSDETIPPIDPELVDKDSLRHDKHVRREHYEQVGQLIAEAATILIAVLDGDEKVDHSQANGGTARVVAFRRAGRPDDQGLTVARKSTVLRCEWGSLVDPPAGFVWLIEPARERATKGYPVVVVPPTEARHGPDGDVGKSLDDETRGTSKRNRDLRGSLIIAAGFDRFHKTVNRQPASTMQTPWAPIEPTDAIASVRKIISGIQGSAKRAAELTFGSVAVLFVLAVLLLEIFVKFYPDEPLFLGAYLGVFLLILCLLLLARWREWQPMSEDYRAVNEMLRVQRVWWSAGLSERVDHLHLQSIDAELARVREAARTILGWIWLRSGWITASPPTTDWPHVKTWTREQISYFEKNNRKYHTRLRQFDAVVWTLFASSAWLAGIMFFLMLSMNKVEPTSGGELKVASSCSIAGLVACVAIAIALIVLRVALASRDGPDRSAHQVSHFWNAVTTAAVGLCVAVLCAVAIELAVIRIERGNELAGHHHTVEHITVLVFVVMSALAGAVRFVADKLNFEAQTLEYRDAKKRFERAQRVMADFMDPKSGLPTDAKQVDGIVEDVGMLALRENEAWLKARRERPLSPVV